jgi:hypothetical protein
MEYNNKSLPVNYSGANFICDWYSANYTVSLEIESQLKSPAYQEKVKQMAIFVLNDLAEDIKNNHVTDSNKILVLMSQKDQLKQIYTFIKGTSAQCQKEQSEFFALTRLMECDISYRLLKRVKAYPSEQNDQCLLNISKFFKRTIQAMLEKTGNNQSWVDPQTRLLFSMIKSDQLLHNIITNNRELQVELGILPFYLEFLSCPEEIYSLEVFHIQVFFQAMEKLAPKMQNQNTTFSCDQQQKIRNEFQNFTDFYINDIFSGAADGSYLLRKSSAPNFYIPEDGFMKIAYFSVTLTFKKDGEIKRTLYYYDTRKNNWIFMGIEANSIEDLQECQNDTTPSDFAAISGLNPIKALTQKDNEERLNRYFKCHDF